MRRPLLLVGTLVALLSAGAVPSALASGTSAAPPGLTAVRTTRSVLLPTGDVARVSVDPAGRRHVEGHPALRSGPGAAFQTVVTDQHAYVIPASARPYLGRVLDLALFDADVLARADAGRVPVRVAFAGATAPAVPGLTVTSRSAGTLRGYLTAASARRFGAALAAQYTADAKTGFPRRTSLFGASSITADLSVPAVATPRYPMRSLILRLLDRAGRPAPFGLVQVYNTESMLKFIGVAWVVDGEALMSVPVGTYGFTTGIDLPAPGGAFGGFGILTLDDVVVSDQNQTVVLDGQRVRSRVSVRTPRPADQVTVQFDLARMDASGDGTAASGFSILGPSGGIVVAPAGRPLTGTLESSSGWNGSGSPVTGTPYRYALTFPGGPGISADQAHTVAERELATLRNTFYVDTVARQGGMFLYPYIPGSVFGGGWSLRVQLPGVLDAQVNPVPGAVYSPEVFGVLPGSELSGDGAVRDGPRFLLRGTTTRQTWFKGPALPNVPVETNGAAAQFGFTCLSCRTDTRMTLGLNFATDSTRGHAYSVFSSPDGTPVARLRVFRNGAEVFDEPDTGLAELAVPRGPATYRVIDEVDRGPSNAFQSVTTRTELTFVSAAGEGGRLPSTWTCPMTGRCTVLPLLRTAVDLPVNAIGSVPIGTSTIGLTINHVQGAPNSTITSATVEVRRPGGTWTALPITDLGGGRYAATLRTTRVDGGRSLDLRVRGADAAGGSIVQSATAAFSVSTS